MTCDICRSHLTALADGELSPEAAAEAERHLASCPDCAQTRAGLAALGKMAEAWVVDAPDIAGRVMQAAASDDQSLLLDEMRRLRTEMQDLRAEVAALRRQFGRRADSPVWTPPARLDTPRMENDPWNSVRS
jgi:anti-sigma factor RsiW